MLPVGTYSCFVSLTIESFKCKCAYKFFTELSYVVLVYHVLPFIISVKDPEPIYWDNRNKTNHKCFHSNIKHLGAAA